MRLKAWVTWNDCQTDGLICFLWLVYRRESWEFRIVKLLWFQNKRNEFAWRFNSELSFSWSTRGVRWTSRTFSHRGCVTRWLTTNPLHKNVRFCTKMSCFHQRLWTVKIFYKTFKPRRVQSLYRLVGHRLISICRKSKTLLGQIDFK